MITDEYFLPSTAAAVPTDADPVTTSPDDVATVPYRRPTRSTTAHAPTAATTSDATEPPTEKKIKLQSIYIDYTDLAFGAAIGKGGMGTVYKGAFRGEDVAIKEIEALSAKATQLVGKDILNEITLHASLNHRNIVQVFGYSQNLTNYYLVMELMHSSVDNFLYGPNGCTLSDGQKFFIAQEMLQ